MANLLSIYVGPYIKFKKVTGLDPSNISVRHAAPSVLPDELEYDIWIPYGDACKKAAAVNTNHRDIGYDYTEISSITESIQKWKVEAARTIHYLVECYGQEPSFHYGIITGPG